MNTPNPLLPQGTLPPREKSSLYFKILMVFAIHIVLIGGILMVGCKDTAKVNTPPKDTTADVSNPNPMSPTPSDFPPVAPSTGPAASTAALPPGGTGVPPAPLGPVATTVTPPATSTPIPAATPVTTPVTTPATIPSATGGSVYVIVAGDMLTTIAKKTGVSVKAIKEANAGLDEKKLQIGHKLQIPASAAVATTAAPKAGGEAATAAASGDGSVYVVKSGDTLGKIATANHTSVKAIKELNDMKTSAIKTNQKLKMPVMKVASADMAPVPAAPAPASGATAPAPMVRAN